MVVAVAPLDNWWLDLFRHFQLQYALLALGLLAHTLLRRGWLLLPVALTLALFHVGWALPLWIPSAQAAASSLRLGSVNAVGSEAAAQPQAVRLLHFNVLVLNTNVRQVVRLIETTDADVVTLNEVEKHWPKQLAASASLINRYPYRVRNSRDVWVLSRWPIQQVRQHGRVDLSDGFRFDSWLELTVAPPDAPPFRLLALHSPTPIRPSLARMQRALFQTIASKTPPETLNNMPTLLVGDLNTTCWSRAYDQLLQTTRLHDARLGRGALLSWGIPWPLGPLGLPIDQVLHTAHWQVQSLTVLPPSGSDHRPLLLQAQYGDHLSQTLHREPTLP